MIEQFKVWFTISVTHGYFLSGGGPLKFIPTPRTASLLKRLGMVMRMEKNMIFVAFSGRRSNDYLTYIGNEINHQGLCFQLVNEVDSRFYNYSNLDFPGKGYLLSYSSERLTQVENGFRLNRIANAANGFVPFASSLRLEDGDKVIDSAGLELPINNDGTYDLAKESEGEYLVSKSSEDQTHYVYYEKGLAPLPVGLVTIKMNSEALAGYIEKVGNGESTEPINYHIQFEARKTIWKYILRQRSEDRDLTKYRVFSSDENDFQRIEGAVGVIFQSVDPIALSEAYTQAFSLRNGQAGKSIIERLPGADCQIIFPETDQGVPKV